VNDGHAETYPIKSSGFRQWLQREFHHATGKIPNAQAVQDAIQTLMGKALFDGPEHLVFTRLGEHDGAIYLDRADPDWMAIRIGPTGWELVKNPPVKFRHARGMLPLPIPVRGGSINDLARFINVWDERTWRLIVAWVLAALRPRGPYPILVLNGEQGSAKSTLAKALRKLVDPQTVLLRRPPRDDRDLMIAAANGWFIVLDNLSRFPDWLSDALCSLATGGGLSTRALYSDMEETLIAATRPIIINSIEEIATRSDFLDRALLVTLPEISDDQRRAEEEFWDAFETARPAILGAFLDVMVVALRTLPRVKLMRRPRMADFAELATAAEPVLGWAPGTFMAAYSGNREDATTLTLDANPVVPPLRALAAEGGFEGTPTKLLQALRDRVDESVTRQPDWPKTANTLSGLLRRLAPNLRATGVEVEFLKGHHPRRVRISSVPDRPTTLSGQEPQQNRARAGDDDRDDVADVWDDHGDDRPPKGTRRDEGDDGFAP
jgi:hypothetical protein